MKNMSQHQYFKFCPQCGRKLLRSTLFCAVCMSQNPNFGNIQDFEPFNQYDKFVNEVSLQLVDRFIKEPLLFQLEGQVILDFLTKFLRAYSIIESLMEDNDSDLLAYFNAKSGDDAEILASLVKMSQLKGENSLYLTVETGFSCAIYFIRKYPALLDSALFETQTKEEQQRLKQIGFNLGYFLHFLNMMVIDRAHTKPMTPQQKYKTYTNQIMVLGTAVILPTTIDESSNKVLFELLRDYVDKRSQIKI